MQGEEIFILVVFLRKHDLSFDRYFSFFSKKKPITGRHDTKIVFPGGVHRPKAPARTLKGMRSCSQPGNTCPRITGIGVSPVHRLTARAILIRKYADEQVLFGKIFYKKCPIPDDGSTGRWSAEKI